MVVLETIPLLVRDLITDTCISIRSVKMMVKHIQPLNINIDVIVVSCILDLGFVEPDKYLEIPKWQ